MAHTLHHSSAMETRVPRLLSFFLGMAAAVLGATSSQATGFTVHSYELGERITLTNGTQVTTAQLNVSVENLVSRVPSFCVDVFTSIGVGQYDARGILDADTAVAPAGEGARNFAWAGHVMETFGNDVARLVTAGITRAQAITGVQAAIWQGIYGGNMVSRSSLSLGAQRVYDSILSSRDSGTDNSWIAEFRGNQDQVFGGSAPIPEPSAALIFGLGTLVTATVLRRRS
jgi:hypothetical protein